MGDIAQPYGLMHEADGMYEELDTKRPNVFKMPVAVVFGGSGNLNDKVNQRCRANANLGRMYKHLGDHAQAERHLQLSLKQAIKQLGTDPQTAASHSQLGALRFGEAQSMSKLEDDGMAGAIENKLGECEEHFEHSLIMCEKNYGINHKQTAQAVRGLALDLHVLVQGRPQY
jgi:hypothetical protein